MQYISEQDLIGIEIDRFPTNYKLPFDVYQKSDSGASIVMYEGELFDVYKKEALKLKGIKSLYVSEKGFEVFVEVNLEKYNKYIHNKDDYHSIDKSVFTPGEWIDFSIYIQNKMEFIPVVDVSSNISKRIPDDIFTKNEIFIKKKDVYKYTEFLKQKVKTNNNIEYKNLLLKEDTKIIIRNILENPLSGGNKEKIYHTASSIINSVRFTRGLSTKELISLKSTDVQIYNHCLNVGILSGTMALFLDYPHEDIENIIVASFYHDIGKSHLPKNVLFKHGMLTPDEYTLWKSHVYNSVIISQNNGLDKNIIDIIRQHHEKMDGSGYPSGITAKTMSGLGKIISLVDAFENLISPSLTKTPRRPFDALSVLMKEAKQGKYDLNLVKLLIRILRL